MKKYYWIIIFAIIKFYDSKAQVAFSPLEQGFEDPIIASGINTEFLPGWWGNDVRTTSSRIFISDRARSGHRALAIQALASYTAEVIIRVDLRDIEAPQLEFFAHSAQNGSGNRPAIVTFSTSLDGGITYTAPHQIGPPSTFPNNNLTSYERYVYPLPLEAGLNGDVRVKMTVSAGAGSGTVARLFMDDFLFFHDPDYVRPYSPVAGDIRINEIMSKPDPVVDLPNAEYVELYNASAHEINLSGFTLSNDVRVATLGYYVFEPGSFLILTSQTNAHLFVEFGNVMGLSPWPILKNEGDVIILKDRSGIIIDQVNYKISWFNDSEKQNGGWSLELADPYSSCTGNDVWQASVNPHGGTPGETNSIRNNFNNHLPARIVFAKAISPGKIEVTFDKGIGTNGLKPEQIRFNHKAIVEKIESHHDRKTFTLNLKQEHYLKEGELVQFSVINYEDCSGVNTPIILFDVGLGKAPQFNDLVISEVMVKPSPSVGLPESQFLEVVNRSSTLITLKGLQLSNSRNLTTLPDENIKANEKIILCPRTRVQEFEQYGRVIGLTNWPTFNITSDHIILVLENEIIFHIKFSDGWYKNSQKQKGGWALEMVDINNPCGESNNWKASENNKGGTPGKENSVKDDNPDLKAPQIEKIIVTDDKSLRVILNEKIIKDYFDPDKLEFDNTLKVLKAEVILPQLNEISIYLEEKMLPKVRYTLTLSGIKDCARNVQFKTSKTFVLPEKATYQDIVVNEVLTNPSAGGVKFVEVYNKTEKFINLKNWKLANRAGAEPSNFRILSTNDLIIEPKQHLVFTTDPNVLHNHYPKSKTENLHAVNSLPSYPISEGHILLIDTEENIIDEFHYKEEYHHPLIKNKKGVSLERINPSTLTNNPNNWKSASADQNYATPGYRNSQSFEDFKAITELTIEPKIFAPETPGYNDFTTIFYKIDQSGYVADIFITDATGKLVKNISTNSSLGSEGFFTWDGTDNNRQRVRTGYYIVLVKLFNMNGETRVLKEKVVVGGRF